MSSSGIGPSELEREIERVQAVRQSHEAELLGKRNVIGLGVGLRQKEGKPTDQVALVVLVRRKLEASLLEPVDRIPEEIDGVPVDVQEVGDLRAGTKLE
jgi:hypothetical protein